MKKAFVFSASVVGVSWLVALVFHLVTGFNGDATNLEGLMKFQTFGMAYMFLPMIVAAILQLISGEAKFVRKGATRYRLTTPHNPIFKFRPRWSWLVAVAIVPLTVGLSILFSGLFAEVMPMKEGTMALYANMGIDLNALPEKDLTMLNSLPSWVMLLGTVVSGLLAGVTINALFAYGEEYGWRGYMVSALKDTKFLPASLLIGFVWGIWHAPLILMGHNNYPNPAWGVAMMTLFCLLVGVVELYFTCKSGTVWAAVFIHGTINALAGLGLIMVPSGNTFLTGMTGVAGAMALVVIIIGIYIYDRFISRERLLSRTLGSSLNRGKSQ